MHPAPSVIFFTSLSGLGFGLLFFLGLGMPSVTGWVGFVFYLIGYALAVGGLLSSTLHLGHPERALKAFSQWRSSWLSREGWAAVSCLLVLGLFASGAVFFGGHWQPLGIIGSLLAFATVVTTSMIYAQLKTVPRWHHWTTPAMFLSTMLAGGALLAGQVTIAIPLLLLAGAAQIAHWLLGDRLFATSGSDLGTATGLGPAPNLRSFEPPHTGTNYLMNEMVFVVGRRRTDQLRLVSLILGFALPVVFLILPFSHILAAFAVVSHILGVLAGRWLFFAQAEHVVGLYYGKR